MAGLRSVLVATDFSQGTEAALGRTLQLPLESEATLTLCHVLPEVPAGLQARLRAGSEAALEKLTGDLRQRCAHLGRGDLRLQPLVAEGTAHVELIRHARTALAQLVVMGRGAPPLPAPHAPGRITRHVIRYGDVPVLVVAHAAQGPYRRACVALDLCDTSPALVELTLSLVAPQAEVTLAHAYEAAFEHLTNRYFTPDQLAQFEAELETQARSGLAHLLALLGPAAARVTTALEHGDPRVRLPALAARERYELLAVGTHGRRGLTHLLLGSVAEALLLRAPCDVLVARPTPVTFALP